MTDNPQVLAGPTLRGAAWAFTTTAADVEALRRAHGATRLDIEAYLRFLEQSDLAAEAARKTRGPRGAPFTLST